MKTKLTSFTETARQFALEQKRKQEKEHRLKQVAQQQPFRAKERRNTIIAALLTKALTNLQILIHFDTAFCEYVTKLFNSPHIVQFSTTSDVCGFEPPLERYEAGAHPEVIAEPENQIPKILSGREDCEIHISVLVLYSEYKSKRNNVDSHDIADGDYMNHAHPVLAMTVLHEHFKAPRIDQLRDCRLVVVEERTDNLQVTSYSKLLETSMDFGFVTVLRKLTHPQSTFDFFLEKFTPPSQ